MNLINEKRCGKIKGQTYANCNTQRGYIHRKDPSSPIISLETLMKNLVVDAYEGQDVAIFYAPGDYLNADMPEEKDARLKL